jgi:hypothetical protein
MSKQKKKKQINNLSPENYIRQRARNLPLYKCWINDDWNTSGIATIFVSRKHVSENITLGFYLADLKCLGVKETFFQYNITEELLLHKLEASREHDLNYVEISYELAHNIIFASIEYAGEYGFDPASDFTRITQYLLEEDSDDIPLIDIHCGDENGQPLYINTGNDTPAREKQVLARLQQTAGHGNYHFFSGAENDYDDEGDDYDDDDDDGEENDDAENDDDNDDNDSVYDKIRDSLSELDEDELKKNFLDAATLFDRGADNPGKQQHEAFIYMSIMADIIINNIADGNKVAEYISGFEKYFDVEFVGMFDLPNSFFRGLQCDDIEKLRNAYWKFVEKIDHGNVEKPLKKLRKLTGDIPAIYYWTSLYLSKDEYDAKIDEYVQQYPDYFLFKMLQYSRDNIIDDRFKTLLQNVNEPVTDIEIGEFFNRYALCRFMYNEEPDIEELIAFEDIVRRYQDSIIFITETLVNTLLTKIKLAKQYYGASTDEQQENL